MTDNLLLMTDSYKCTHWRQYPPRTQRVYSYFESRGGQFPATVFFGLQYYLKRYLSRPITAENIAEAKAFFTAHLGNAELFNEAGWNHILNVHGGYLPVSIKAVPEGSVIPTHNVLMTIENTDPELPWLTNYLETLLVQVWYGTTVATLSREMRKLILGYLERSGDPGLVAFKLHDFGFRGVSSVESAGVGGAGHLVNFMGTDTVAALTVARDYYGEPMAGFSIPAAEHSTITSWGKEYEDDAFRNMINQFGHGAPGLYAVVSDSYDIRAACSELWGRELKDAVLAAPNTLVVRPDSGVPHDVVMEVLTRLGEAFGTTQNNKGYKVLNKVRVIQGDGVDYKEVDRILMRMINNRWSADNIAFGMGGALLQKLNRDTQRFAFKCSAVQINDEWHHVRKSPADDTFKHSKAGRLSLFRYGSEFQTVADNVWRTPGQQDLLQEVFRNGKVLVDQTFADIRARAATVVPSDTPVFASV